MNQAFIDRSVTLSAGQAAGTASVLAENTTRAALILCNASANNMYLQLATGGSTTTGVALKPGETISFGMGSPVPTNVLFVVGTASDRLTIWEA